ncbi:MAG: acylphosphatase [Treponema sp.]|nr:acylphosphatase [Treponema sp.]
MEEKIRQQFRFTGRVQGVGFRYTAKYAAESLGVTGWVFNDYDDSVLMEAQGTLSQINQVIEKLEKGIFIEIDNIERKNLPLIKSEHYFEIK